MAPAARSTKNSAVSFSCSPAPERRNRCRYSSRSPGASGANRCTDMATTPFPDPPVRPLERMAASCPASQAAMAAYMPASPPPITSTELGLRRLYLRSFHHRQHPPFPLSIAHAPEKTISPSFPVGSGYGKTGLRAKDGKPVFSGLCTAMPVYLVGLTLASRALLRTTYTTNVMTMLTTAGTRKLWLMAIWPQTVPTSQDSRPSQLTVRFSLLFFTT